MWVRVGVVLVLLQHVGFGLQCVCECERECECECECECERECECECESPSHPPTHSLTHSPTHLFLLGSSMRTSLPSCPARRPVYISVCMSPHKNLPSGGSGK